MSSQNGKWHLVSLIGGVDNLKNPLKIIKAQDVEIPLKYQQKDKEGKVKIDKKKTKSMWKKGHLWLGIGFIFYQRLKEKFIFEKG